MIQIYNNKHLTWDDTTSINHYELFADTVTDLPSDPYCFSSPDGGNYKMAQGSIAWVIDVSELYMLDSSGTWVLETIGGGGGGTTDYNALINKPSINNIELSGNKSLSDLGIQSAIEVTSTDNGKVLTAAYSGGMGTFSWMDSSGGNCDIIAKTTAQWNADPTLISKLNTLYVYTDYETQDGVDIPALKVGDGLAYLIDLPFTYTGDVTPEQLAFWNNKVTAYMDPTHIETLILSKD